MTLVDTPVNYSVAKIESIYFDAKPYRVYNYEGSKDKFKVAVAFTIAFVLFLYLSYFDAYLLFWFSIMAFICSVISGIDTFWSYKHVYDWKIQTKAYLKEVATYQSVRLTVTDKSITHQYDDKTEIITWQSITSSSITPDYIHLVDKAKGVLIFKHSINAEEYEKILTAVKEKIL